MGKKWRQLKYEDRLKIYAWLQDKTSVATIAKRLGVCRQTIYREIKRGEFVKRNTDYTESTVYENVKFFCNIFSKKFLTLFTCYSLFIMT